MEIVIRHSAPSCRGLASPKASVGVWLLVLIVCLPFLGHIACFWCGVGGGRAGGVGLCGSEGAWVGLCWHMLEGISAGDLLRRVRTLNAAACTGRLAQSIPRAGGRARRNFDLAKDHLLAGLSEWRIRIAQRVRDEISIEWIGLTNQDIVPLLKDWEVSGTLVATIGLHRLRASQRVFAHD